MKRKRSPQRDFSGNLRSTISSCSTFAEYSPAEALEFYEQIRAADPRQRIVFLTGPPKYVSRTWPGEIADGDTSRGHLSETVKRFLVAA